VSRIEKPKRNCLGVNEEEREQPRKEGRTTNRETKEDES
jgi:hypothetical protein